MTSTESAIQTHPSTSASSPLSGKLPVLYTLFFSSGVAALVYEVMWLRSFSLVFGSTTQATSAVLGAFFAGLAVGGLAGGQLAGDRSRALWRYGLAEIGIAAGALLVDVWIGWFRAVYPSLYPLGGWALTSSKLLLAFVAMGIPCVAMGATLPLITRAIVSWPGHLGRRVGTAYALNTLGATLGVLLAGFVLPPAIGTQNSVYLAVALNIGVGVVAMLLARSGRGEIEDGAETAGGDGSDTESPAPSKGWADPAVLLIVAASGFGTVALEVLYTRLIVNATDSSVFSFALMLATFLVFLALASLVVSWAIDRVASPWRLLAWTQTLAVVAIVVSPSLFELSSASTSASLSEYLLGLLRQLALVVGPTILLLGMALPITWKIATRRAAESGLRVGRLTSLNTLGAVAGSVVTGFVLVPTLGIGRGFALIAVFYAVIALVSWLRGYGRARALLAGATLVLVLAAAYLLGTMRAFLLLLEPEQTLVLLIEGESVNVAVLEDPRLGRILKINNSYILGRSDPLAVQMQRAQGGLPLLLHPTARHVAFIGVATGVSVSAVLDFPRVPVRAPLERVLAIELLSEVVEATPYFWQVNRWVLEAPHVETLVADGRNHLFATGETFDAVVGDLFAPWQAGTGYLYTREHFESVESRLAEGGVFVQWLPAHQLTVDELRIIVATFLDVFPSAELWLNRPDPKGLGGLALVGRAEGGALPLDRTAAESSEAFPGLSHLCGAATLREFSTGAPRNSDDYPRIEFSAAVSRFTRGGQTRDMRETIAKLAQGS